MPGALRECMQRTPLCEHGWHHRCVRGRKSIKGTITTSVIIIRDSEPSALTPAPSCQLSVSYQSAPSGTINGPHVPHVSDHHQRFRADGSYHSATGGTINGQQVRPPVLHQGKFRGLDLGQSQGASFNQAVAVPGIQVTGRGSTRGPGSGL